MKTIKNFIEDQSGGGHVLLLLLIGIGAVGITYSILNIILQSTSSAFTTPDQTKDNINLTWIFLPLIMLLLLILGAWNETIKQRN
jgi:hypothetical protein